MKKVFKILTIFLTCCTLIFSLACCTSQTENSLTESVKSSKRSSNSTVNTENSLVNSTTSTDTSSTTNSETSSAPSDENTDVQNLSFAEKTDRFLDGATINDENFISYYKSLGEYDFNESLRQNALFVSPNATSNGDGSESNPYTFDDALYIVKKGQTIYLRGGLYNAPQADGYYIETQGDANNYITIRNYPGETPIITNTKSGSELYAFSVAHNACYTVIEGIEIKNIHAYNAYGIAFWGNNQNHIIMRNLKIHDMVTTSSNPEKETESSANAILLYGQNKNPISNIIIANCELYDNVTGWAETLSVAANCEYVYVLENRVYDNTNIGIDFCGNAGGCSTKSLDQPRYSVASGNFISNSHCNYSDCAGLYVDGGRDILLQYNTVTKSQFGLEIGSEERSDDYPVKNITVRNNLFYDNTVVGMRVGGYEEDDTGVVYSTVFINNTLKNNGDEIVIAKVDGISYINNLITTQKGNIIAKTDFSKSYCKNITFTNNYFNVENTDVEDYEFEMFESYQSGITAFKNATGASVVTGNISLDENFAPIANFVVIDNGVTGNFGNYDYNLSPRVNGSKVDIGAIESK